MSMTMLTGSSTQMVPRRLARSCRLPGWAGSGRSGQLVCSRYMSEVECSDSRLRISVAKESGVKSKMKAPPPSAALVVNAKNFDDVVNGDKNVLVAFTAPWVCSLCISLTIPLIGHTVRPLQGSLETA